MIKPLSHYALLGIMVGSVITTGCKRPGTAPRFEKDAAEEKSVPDSRTTKASIPPASVQTPSPHGGEQRPAPAQAITLVEDGKAHGVIVISGQSDHEALANYFVRTIERATGVRVSVIKEGSEGFRALPANQPRVVIGETEESRALGLSVADLPEEGYRIKSNGGSVFVIGKETKSASTPVTESSQPTRWALNYLLEAQLGVRWLWPGEVGTFVPRHDSFAIPVLDRNYQPTLRQRRLRIGGGPNFKFFDKEEFMHLNPQVNQEAIDWVANHQQGQRGNIRFGHAFGHWWNRYGKDHPDYFAETPAGITQPSYNHPEWVKLRLSNPAVIEQIAKEYEEAGSPEFWNICPNDGAGFDLSKETLAWDHPKDQSLDDIWRAKANLTARYVRFWNLLYDRLKKINPEVKLATYAYSSYKTPPHPDHPLTAAAAIGVVPGYRDYDLWDGWAAQPGTQIMYLRPNWGHQGANAPHIPLKEVADYLHFAWKHKMEGLDIDAVVGFWANQGTNYYLWARLMTRPDLSLSEIIDEYASAFGAGAEKIKQYLAYWEDITTKYAYADVYASDRLKIKGGLYTKYIREKKIVDSWTIGPRQVLPLIYHDRALDPAFKLLDEAASLIGSNDPDALARVEFLRDGLKELIATRDLVAESRNINRHSSADQRRKFQEDADALDALREELTGRHVLWGAPITRYENFLRVPMRPQMMSLPELNLDGL